MATVRWSKRDSPHRVCGVEEQHLLGIITMAVETGIRKSEITELRWDRVDLSRNVLRLEVTKSGRRREVPMRDVVYKALAERPGNGNHVGRVWPDRNVRKAFETAVRRPGWMAAGSTTCGTPSRRGSSCAVAVCKP